MYTVILASQGLLMAVNTTINRGPRTHSIKPQENDDRHNTTPTPSKLLDYVIRGK